MENMLEYAEVDVEDDEVGNPVSIEFRYFSMHEGDSRPDIACIVQFDDVVLTGVAFCNPLDQYDARIGRKVAFTRAIKDLPRQVRSALWQAYWEQGIRRP